VRSHRRRDSTHSWVASAVYWAYVRDHNGDGVAMVTNRCAAEHHS